MNERFDYCGNCKNKGMCKRCYRGSYYERDDKKDPLSVYGTF